jgi:hypothetical protein
MKTKNRRNYLKQDGITLIALVVTIVVLLILAGVSINALFGNSGIIEKAKDVQNKMDQAEQNDLDSIGELEKMIDSQLPMKTYEETSKKDGVLTKNAIYTDSEKTTVTIPKGFKVSDVAATGDKDGEQTVSKGLVIQDKDGNEFVWVPVNYTATGTLDADGLDSGFKNTFRRTTNTDSNYSEPSANGYDGEDTDYIKMMQSVQKNKGFYIGRYEAGTTIPRTNSTKTKSEVVVKRDAYPYIYVGWGIETNDVETDVTFNNQLRGKGAVYLSKHMYDKKDIGATSTLCYGVQWDATMTFVADSTHSTSNSKNWGNYKNNPWTITRTTASYSENNGESYTKITSNKSKTNTESILLTTGASDTFKAKNIFDLAGNVYEWTMVSYRDSGRVIRGGVYILNGSDSSASGSNYNVPYVSNNSFGFRPALYL